jgi:hypothetical protein
MAQDSADRRAENGSEYTNVVRALLLGSGLLFLAAALLYDPQLVTLGRGAAPSALEAEKMCGVRFGFAIAGALLVAAFALVDRWHRARSLAAGRRAATLLLAVLALTVPAGLVEFGLRPFAEPRTTLFTPDRELGWRLVPGARDEWGGVRVSINARGMRGPALDHEKPEGTLRILFLGDSVTFGYGVERDEDLFAQGVGRELTRRLGRPVEIVNAGVGGYSPWQQALFFEREGVRYAPDLVVVGFVTEKLALVRYGGETRGWQLERTARGALDRWLSGSAVAAWLGDALARIRFGRDVSAGALREEAADVRRLARDPDAPAWRRAWSITTGNLDRIFALAASREIESMLVIFPYAFQLDAPARSGGPQRRLVAHALARGVPVLDLLPLLGARRGAAPDFIDESHLSPEGHRAVAAALVDFVMVQELLSPHRDPS